MLLLSSGYFLEREITSACARLGWPLARIAVPKGGLASQDFVASLLTGAARFSPDFALAINHIGLDQKGALLSLFERLRLPLASWFVDSPRLILHDFTGQLNPWLALFTWDKDTVAPLSAQGFEAVHYLPLATDTTLFTPTAGQGDPQWQAQTGFVGDSMHAATTALARKLARFARLAPQLAKAAQAFRASESRQAVDALAADHPELHAAVQALPTAQDRLNAEQYLTFEATRLYRLDCVRGLLPLHPVVAGDAHWKRLLPASGWRHLPRLDYYADLPRFYPACAVNLNATSLQMKGAVNQRVFDIPACGGFVLTDAREQLAELFEPGREAACYERPQDITEAAARWLASPAKRQAIMQAARERILAQHDYTHRLQAMLKAMRRRYA